MKIICSHGQVQRWVLRLGVDEFIPLLMMWGPGEILYFYIAVGEF